MKVLFDQGTPVPLRHVLIAHEVATAFERGWQTLKNGDLLLAAEAAGFEAIVTTDQNLRYQQNLAGRHIAILVLSTTNWRRIQKQTELVVQALESLPRASISNLRYRNLRNASRHRRAGKQITSVRNREAPAVSPCWEVFPCADLVGTHANLSHTPVPALQCRS